MRRISSAPSRYGRLSLHAIITSIIAGYDLLKQPSPPSGAALAALDARIISAIRTVDANHLVLLEGSNFAQDFSMFHTPLTPNQAYSFHMYSWFGDDRQRRLAGYRRQSLADEMPMWNGEFGENRCDMIAGTLRMFRDPAYGLVGSCFFTWKRAPDRYPGLRTFAVPPGWQAIMSCAAHPLQRWRRPAQPDAIAAGSALLNAVAIAHTEEDRAMVNALTQP